MIALPVNSPCRRTESLPGRAGKSRPQMVVHHGHGRGAGAWVLPFPRQVHRRPHFPAAFVARPARPVTGNRIEALP
jgi:hypothetical protein